MFVIIVAERELIRTIITNHHALIAKVKSGENMQTDKKLIIIIRRGKAFVEFPKKYEKHRIDIINFLSHYVSNIEWRFT